VREVEVSEAEAISGYEIPFPLEIVINAYPVSSQTDNKKAKEAWKKFVGECAQNRINDVIEWYYLDERPLMAIIYFFPPDKMDGDIDNIVKPILDGMIAIAYPDDRLIERSVVQKFEPHVEWSFSAPSPMLASALDMDPPALYIRLEADTAWRHFT